MKTQARRRFSLSFSELEGRNLMTVFQPVVPGSPILPPPIVGLPGPLPAPTPPPGSTLGTGTYGTPVLPPPTWITGK